MSNIIANLAVAAAFIPIVKTLIASGIPSVSPWRALVVGACLGGNVTPIGSMDNILVMTLAQKNGIKFPWGKFMKLGLIVVNIQFLIFSALFLLGLM